MRALGLVGSTRFFFTHIVSALRVHCDSEFHEVDFRRNFGWHLVCGHSKRGGGIVRLDNQRVIALVCAPVS